MGRVVRLVPQISPSIIALAGQVHGRVDCCQCLGTLFVITSGHLARDC
jgi:hypothetical protein